MSKYINPVKTVLASAMRSGGGMDTTELGFICQQCGQRVSLTLRQAHRGAKPVCPTCGAGATMISARKAQRIAEDSDHHT
ncbi:MAG: hypothetical protein DME24_08780 [Verrucomicrobia bacterium]|nr:MAG: hypothetical protein DME24_08780 [Verrucomicrobiota bacterium]